MMPARFVNQGEQRKRGCLYCFDMALSAAALNTGAGCASKLRHMMRGDVRESENLIPCPHAQCPYRELDGVKDYAQQADAQGAPGEFLDPLRYRGDLCHEC